ncbi:conserved exported hypothetical protein [Flavobacterium sp. 9AF]|uniref:hypothetical protein n=1 Tax=Flavobacterium sp. 9AF TaxID=2653142 RepID=UPI0012F23548|nr:hypothetical protein [Flavobacterium sp. 9AF]VXB03447.1 conserved exported hypothetical protein [Flavobacterium sp. 9AF]
MKPVILYFLVLVFVQFSNAQVFNADYFDYHTQINKAEIFLYKDKNVDSCFYYYDKTFKEFDFIFLKDLLIAAQIAKINKRNPQKYILQAFENGLKMNHLDNFPVLKEATAKIIKDDKLQDIIIEKRKKYLSRIDFDYLDRIYDFAIKDLKNRELDLKDYHSKLASNVTVFSELIQSKGFPSDKLLGISDSTIFREVKLPKNDITSRENKIPTKHKFYKRITETYFSNYFLNFFLKNASLCFFKSVSKDVILREIKRGNLHPNDLAYLSDLANYNSVYNHLDNCGNLKVYPFFSPKLDEKNEFNIYESNKIREAFYMLSYEIEVLKRTYQNENKSLTLFYNSDFQR